MRRLATAVLIIAAVAALAACGSSTPDPTPGQTTAGSGTGTLGEGLTTTPTATASTTPTTTATAPADGLPAPHSSLANKAGYVWVYQAAADFNAGGAYLFNSSGGGISVVHAGTGVYKVDFAGLATGGGVAHAQAYGSTANYCTVASWYPMGDAQEVQVTCFTPAGAPADTVFVASFAEGSQGSSRFSYLWADDASAAAKYHPSASYRYDSVKSDLITVQRASAGRYEVYLPAAGNLGSKPWTFQITAYNSNNLCKLQSYSSSSRKAQIACRKPNGALTDSQFSLTFASGGSFVGRTDRPYGAFSEDSDGLETPSTGVYAVRAPNLGSDKGQVVVLSRGTSSTYCHVQSWSAAGSDLKPYGVCFNPGGTPANSSFELAITL